MVMCVKQQKNAIEVKLKLRIWLSKQKIYRAQTPQNLVLTYISLKENKLLLCLLFNHNLEILQY